MSLSGHVIVCGLGQVGYHIADLLLSVGERIVVVTREAKPARLKEIRERGATVLLGDGTDVDVLAQASISEAKALIAAADDDLANIEIALDAKALNPELHVVARLFDQHLSRRLEESFGIDRALAMSSVSAPAFVAASFGDSVATTFSFGGTNYMVQRHEVREGDPFAGQTVAKIEAFGDLVVLGHCPAGGDIDPAPQPDLVVSIGDRLKFIGERSALHKISNTDLPPARASAPGHWQRVLNPVTALRFIGRVAAATTVELKALVALILGLTFVSVLVFHLGLEISILDAFYFVITTLTTTGYGDINVMSASPGLKIYGMLLMVLGSAALATLYAIITDYIVTARFQQMFGRQRVHEKGHVIVAGLGNVGYRVVEELLRLDVKVVAIEASESAKYFSSLRARVPVILGDAREPETLERAHVDKAVAIIAVTGNDAVNMSIALASESTSPHTRTVVRMFAPALAEKVQQTLDVDVALSAARIAAPAFVGAALCKDALMSVVLRGHLFIFRPEENPGIRNRFRIEVRKLSSGLH